MKQFPGRNGCNKLRDGAALKNTLPESVRFQKSAVKKIPLVGFNFLHYKQVG
jgi:hypothetical protein